MKRVKYYLTYMRNIINDEFHRNAEKINNYLR